MFSGAGAIRPGAGGIGGSSGGAGAASPIVFRAWVRGVGGQWGSGLAGWAGLSKLEAEGNTGEWLWGSSQGAPPRLSRAFQMHR